MKLDKLFLTGCDIKTEWQLPWFLNNYLKQNLLMQLTQGLSKKIY